MRRLRFKSCLAVGALTAGRLWGQSPEPGQLESIPEPALSLERAFEIAGESNESLAAARFKLPVAQAGVDVAKQRPNPEFSFETTEKETPHDAFTLGFPIETAGKRGRRVRTAEAGVVAGQAEVAQFEMGIRSDVRRAFYTLVAAQDRHAQALELEKFAGRIHDAAGARFEAGAAPRLEVIQSDLASDQTRNDVLDAAASISVARAELNLLLGRPPDHETTAAGDLAAGEILEPDAARRMALAGSSELTVLDKRILEQEARVELARAGQYPDPVLIGALTHGAQPEFVYGWRAGLSVTLPVLHHHAAELRLEEQTLSQLHAERAAAAARIEGAAFSGSARTSALREQLRTYRDEMIPKADDVQAMAEDSYRSGQSSLVAMIQSIQAIRDIRARALAVGLDYQVARAELERAIGAPLP